MNISLAHTYHINKKRNSVVQMTSSHQISSIISAGNKKLGRPHRIKRVIAIASIALAFTFASLNTSAQTTQGYVTSKETGAAIENITVEAILQSDTTERKNTITDNAGFYKLENITAIDDMPEFRGDKMTITYSGSKLEITINGKHKITTGKLYSTDGKIVAVTNFVSSGSNQFQGIFDISGMPQQTLLFTDGVHPARKIINHLLSTYETETIDLSIKSYNTLKNASVTSNYIFRLKDNEAQVRYNPLETVVGVDLENVNSIDFQLVKKETTQQVAYLWRAFIPELMQHGTTADIIISNLELNYNDTIFAVNDGAPWRDTVPVNATGTTNYTMKIIPHVREGNIPLYTETKTFELEPNQTAQGYDDLKALEQQQKIKGKVVYGDSKTNATGLDIIIWNSDRTIKIDSIRSEDGTYETGPYAVGFEGQMDVHIPNNHPTRKDTTYFGHKGIRIMPRGTNPYPPNGGPVLMEDKVTNFTDSIKTYNIVLTPTHWIDAETGKLAKVNPAHLHIMDGNNDYDLELLKWGTKNAYIVGINDQWVYEMAERIRKNFGIPFEINEVSTPRSSSGVNITSLDDDYLNSIKNQMGMNIEVSQSAGITETNGGDELEDIHVHSTTDIRIRGLRAGQIGSSFTITESERELLHRMKEATDISKNYYVSIGNYTMPNHLDTTKMVYDHINFSIMDNNRRMRINSNENERIHNGTWTIRQNKNSEYYNNKTQGELYSEERWKHWDTTNIPEFNQKFFE